MNKKRKLNELYKGVFKNDKKSCIVDLMPLDKKQENKNNKHDPEVEENNSKIVSKLTKPNSHLENKTRGLNVSLKVNKNVGFGTYFKTLREEIVDIFSAKDDYISFEGLINSNLINDLFNGNNHESTTKDRRNVTVVNDLNENESASVKYRQLEASKFDEEMFEGEEEILFENETETIFKRKKVTNRKFDIPNSNNIIPSYNNYYNQEFNNTNVLNVSKVLNKNKENIPTNYQSNYFKSNRNTGDYSKLRNRKYTSYD
jgi:hypothetical protein